MQFKNTLLALSALMSAALWAPQAQAIPAFARQVGMACSACHYQHFPVLNSFGRSFKENGYTMIGAQEKIEDTSPPGLSIPAVLNGALVGYMAYQKTNGQSTPNGTGTLPTPTNETSKNTNDGSLMIPQQVSLFLAGRAGEHIGFETEINLSGSGVETAGATGAGLIRIKVPIVYDVGNVHAGVVPFSTQGLGVADSFEVLNTGAVAVHAFNQSDMSAISAQQYIGTSTAANGVAFIASNDDFFANVAKWGANSGAGTSGGPSSNYFRGAWTTGLIPGFDSAIGFQVWNGTSAVDPDMVAGAGGPAQFLTGVVDTKASAIDAQMMGDVGGMPLLLVASYAKAPKVDNSANPNLFNQNPGERKSFNIGAELGVLPGKATLQVGYRNAKSGGYVDGVSGNASDNALLLGATYNLALNVRMELTYSKYSGDMYNGYYSSQVGTYMGDSMTMVDLAFGF
jgi:hypothetical protein